jgi:hypothetical protein
LTIPGVGAVSAAQIAEAAGFSVAGAGVLIGMVSESTVAAWAIGITGLGMAAVSVYARYRETRRNQDVEDERALADSRAKLVSELRDDLKAALESKAELQAIAAERMAIIHTLRATCVHHDQCPVRILDQRGQLDPPSKDSEA